MIKLSKRCALIIRCLILLLIPPCAHAQKAATVHGWKICAAEGYAVSVPAEWSCEARAEGDRLTASSATKEVRFAARSRLTAFGETLPDPALFKEQLSDELDLTGLAGPAGSTRYALTVENVAVETINNLRGAIAEITLAEPALTQGRVPVLVKSAGFALLARGRGRQYAALVLCPLERFAYNSVLMNRIVNDIRAGGRGAGAAAQEGAGLDGVWQLSEPGGKFRMSLRAAGGAGTLRVEWDGEGREAYAVEQRVFIRTVPYGLLVVGSRPAYVSGGPSRAPYAADTLLFQRQLDDTFKVWIRDDLYVKEWKPLKVESHTLGYRLQL